MGTFFSRLVEEAYNRGMNVLASFPGFLYITANVPC